MTPLLLPAFDMDSSALKSDTPQPSPSYSARLPQRKRHCDDPDCCIWVAAVPEAQRWATFDAFNPADVDDYGRLTGGDRANQLKRRAKARLMPRSEPYLLRATPARANMRPTQRRRQPHRESSPCTPAPSTPTRFASPMLVRTPPSMDIDIRMSSPTTPIRSAQNWPAWHPQSTPSELQSSPRTPRRNPIRFSDQSNNEIATPGTVIATSPSPLKNYYRHLSPSPVKKYGP